MTSATESSNPSKQADADQKPAQAPAQHPRHNPDFPTIGWAPESKALAVLADFMTFDWRTACPLPAPPDTNAAEVSSLLARMPDRAERMTEILSHHADTFPDWAALIGPISAYPRLSAVLVAGRMVARTLAMHHKRYYGRARPQQVLPSLRPVVAVPQTPSYPSAHATEAYLMAATLSHVAPQLADAANTLATRIAGNREIGGLNYPSDTQAGHTLAASAFTALSKKGTGFQQMLASAKAEWDSKAADPYGIKIGPDEDDGGGGF
jgi:membrane-associated phospholipid phosphatase